MGSDEYDGYFDWLCREVGVNIHDDSYADKTQICYELHDMDFFYVLELDRSRAYDGEHLREEYWNQDKSEDWVMFLDKPCSVFEMLIALARRMDDMLTGDGRSESSVDRWFWEFIDNLKGSVVGIDSLAHVVEKWMSRSFDSNGVGSIFPLKNTWHDQRERTISYQMADYIFENYFEME